MPEISQDLMANFAEELEAKIEAELQISGLYNTMVVLGVYTNLVTEVVNTILSKTLPLSTEEYLRQVLDTNQASILSEPLVQIDTTISPPRLTYILPPRILIEEGRESPSSLPMKSSRDPNLNSKSNSNSNANSNSPRILAGPAVGFSIKMAAAGRSFQIMRMSLPVAASVRVQILDARGQSRRTLFKGRLESGKHAFPYDGRGERGRSLPAGIYFCRFQANAEVRTIPASNLP